jgi:hypothetical protein
MARLERPAADGDEGGRGVGGWGRVDEKGEGQGERRGSG